MKTESGTWKVEYIRDGLIEEEHEGFLVFNGDKKYDTPYYLRSCAKPLQATLLIDNEIELESDELALICGIHSPLSKSMQDKMLLKGENFSAIHNNCSGKHIGFLILCKKNGWDMKNYDFWEHPLQIAVKNKINTMCGVNNNYPITTDGCGVPILSMPLWNMTQGFIELLNYPQIIEAIKNNAYIFGGENRTDTEIISGTENLIAKVGAGGLCVVLNVKEKSAFAIKINDCSMEARKVALFEIINSLEWGNLKYEKDIKTLSGKKVGEIVFSFVKK